MPFYREKKRHGNIWYLFGPKWKDTLLSHFRTKNSIKKIYLLAALDSQLEMYQQWKCWATANEYLCRRFYLCCVLFFFLRQKQRRRCRCRCRRRHSHQLHNGYVGPFMALIRNDLLLNVTCFHCRQWKFNKKNRINIIENWFSFDWMQGKNLLRAASSSSCML